jgi:hypothetical protein
VHEAQALGLETGLASQGGQLDQCMRWVTEAEPTAPPESIRTGAKEGKKLPVARGSPRGGSRFGVRSVVALGADIRWVGDHQIRSVNQLGSDRRECAIEVSNVNRAAFGKAIGLEVARAETREGLLFFYERNPVGCRSEKQAEPNSAGARAEVDCEPEDAVGSRRESGEQNRVDVRAVPM